MGQRRRRHQITAQHRQAVGVRVLGIVGVLLRVQVEARGHRAHRAGVVGHRVGGEVPALRRVQRIAGLIRDAVQRHRVRLAVHQIRRGFEDHHRAVVAVTESAVHLVDAGGHREALLAHAGRVHRRREHRHHRVVRLLRGAVNRAVGRQRQAAGVGSAAPAAVTTAGAPGTAAATAAATPTAGGDRQDQSPHQHGAAAPARKNRRFHVASSYPLLLC